MKSPADDPAEVEFALRAARKIGRGQPWLIDEFESVALVALAGAGAKYDSNSSVAFRAFAWTFISRAIIDFKRSWRPEGYRRNHPEQLKFSRIEDVHDDGTELGREVEWQDELEWLARSLPGRHGNVLRLLYGHASCRTLAATANRLGISEQYACMTHKEAIRILGHQLRSIA